MLTKPDSARTQAVRLCPCLSVYKQPASPYWYARVYMPIGRKSLHARSTRTTDFRDAKRKAEAFYAELLHTKRYGSDGPDSGLGPLSCRFDEVADEWLDRMKAEAGADPRKLRAYKDAKNLYLAKNGLAAFFGKMELSALTTYRIRKYLVFAAQNSKGGQLASTTKRNHLTQLKNILKFAQEKGLITGLPLMPKVKLVDNPRSWFDPVEYRLLWRCAGSFRRHCKLSGDLKEALAWEELRDFIIFMVNTHLRPSEWQFLKHKHIKVHADHPQPHLEIAVANGKTGQRIVYSMPTAVRIYSYIVKRHGRDPEAYLFAPRYSNRTTAYEVIHHGFNRLLAETDLGPDRFGKKRTIYSLRHTSLMLRLLNGDNVDYFALAKNAGTSVDQLQRFYLSHVNPVMKLESLQSFKRS